MTSCRSEPGKPTPSSVSPSLCQVPTPDAGLTLWGWAPLYVQACPCESGPPLNVQAAPVSVDPTLCPSLTLWERALPAKTYSQSQHLSNCAPPIRTPSRAEPAPTITGSCMDLCQVQPMSRLALVGADPTPCPSLTLWERALPAKTSSRSQHFPKLCIAHPDAFAGRARSHNY